MMMVSSWRGRPLFTTILAALALGAVACGGGESVAARAIPVGTATVDEGTSLPATTPLPDATSTSPFNLPASVDEDQSPTTPTAEATPTAEPVIASLEELVDAAGYPADATLGRVRIPILGLDVPFAPRYVGGETEQLPLPAGPADVVWYDMSEWPGLGGAPGDGGNAIFSGHVDYADFVPYAGVNYQGRGVFADLDVVARGDVIEIEYGGETRRYGVNSVRKLSAAPGATDWGAVWSGDVAVEMITLYTCGGAFDASTRTYIDRVVVQAELLYG